MDPAPVLPLDPGSGTSKKSTGMNILDHISESFLVKKYFKSGIFLTLDPAGIRDGQIRIRDNYPDQQHCYLYNITEDFK